MSEPTVGADELRVLLGDPDHIATNTFSVLQDLCCFVSAQKSETEAQEMVLRALEHREVFGEGQSILDDLARRYGLFPYLDPETLSVADQIAYELHRPSNLGEDTVLHRAQANVYWALLEGQNVVLSAPTSFGKSLVIDAAIASGRFQSILIVVPTIALIDETRRRLSCRFGSDFKIITQHNQTPGERTIYVLTQERALELDVPRGIDLLVVDEFYKLRPTDANDTRADLLNQVVYRFTKSAKQFYMLGPNISGFSPEFGERLQFTAIFETYRTVVSEFHKVDCKGQWGSKLVETCKALPDPTIIFSRSPNRAVGAAKYLVEAGLGVAAESCREAADWVAEHYHPEWHVVSALRQGIGLHHGRLPRALAQFMVREFNLGALQYLVCTSTLIEGVNTSAKNIIILDNTINRTPIDLFTFNNISGRAGRMGQHFIGHVYLFDPPPDDGLMFVDMPIFSQDEEASESLLIQMDEEDLTERSKERIGRYVDQGILEYATIKANLGIDIDMQLNLAREIDDNVAEWLDSLQWTGRPSQAQLYSVCELIWRHFNGRRLGSGSVRSSVQLATLIRSLMNRSPIIDLIEQQIPYCGDSADAAATQVLDFVRLWARFHFPRLLMALHRIQTDILGRYGIAPGNYEAFATSVENLFLPSEIVALDEYGVDLEIARKLVTVLSSDGDMDLTLEKLKALDVDSMDLSPFEAHTINDAQAFL